LGINPA